MSILKKLQKDGSPLSNGNGATPNRTIDEKSKLHYGYSINGKPHFENKPKPSVLDLDGKTQAKYLDNPPQ